jgi:hypothetical protein
MRMLIAIPHCLITSPHPIDTQKLRKKIASHKNFPAFTTVETLAALSANSRLTFFKKPVIKKREF